MSQTTDAIDQLSLALMDEFAEHRDAYLKLNPVADPRMIFEAWVIQKLASIHYLLGDRPRITGDEGA